jgi:hypothetical protein
MTATRTVPPLPPGAYLPSAIRPINSPRDPARRVSAAPRAVEQRRTAVYRDESKID